MYVYADILLLVNAVMNSLILVLTAWVAGITYKIWRLVAAAGLGSLYALGGVVDTGTFLYSLPVKLAMAALLVMVAFGRRPWRTVLLITAYFYIVSLLVGGAVLGWLMLASAGGPPWPRVSAWHLAAGAGAAISLLVLVGRRLVAGLGRRRLFLPVCVGLGGREVRLTGLLDTGNQLYTVGSRRPVIVIDYEAVEPLFSTPVRDYLRHTRPEAWLADLANCPDADWLARVQAVPCRGASGSGLFLGFRPDRITIITASGNAAADAVIALHSGRLDPSGAYAALLHPAAMQGLEGKEGANICA